MIGAEGADWRRRMSSQLAAALLAYTALQIAVTMRALSAGAPGTLPLAALALLVVIVIPACRRFERRWNAVVLDAAEPAMLAGRFRRECAGIWAAAVGVPLALGAVLHLIGL